MFNKYYVMMNKWEWKFVELKISLSIYMAPLPDGLPPS